MEFITLNNGVKMPQLGYGVYQVSQEECERCVLDALQVGLPLHRHGTILLQRRAGGHSNRKIPCGSQRYFSDHQGLGRALRL